MDANTANIVLALIALISAPLMAFLTNRYRRQEAQETYERQDKVAALLLQANERVSKDTKTLTEDTRDVKREVTVIKKMVDGVMTATMQDSLDSLIILNTTLRDTQALKEANHLPIKDSDKELIARNEAEIEKRLAIIDRRKRELESAENQAAFRASLDDDQMATDKTRPSNLEK